MRGWGRGAYAAAAVLGAVLLAAASARAASPACLSGNAGQIAADQSAIESTRAAVGAMCPCTAYDGSQGKGRGAYGRCANTVIRAFVDGGILRKQCRAPVRRMSTKSTCGIAASKGAGVCVRRHMATGRVSCAIKTPASRCTSNPGIVQSAVCSAHTHCIDAVDSNHDMRVAAPGDSGICNGTGSSPTPTPTPRPQGTPDPFPTGTDGQRLAQLINQHRVANGKAALPLSNTMMAVAGAHVADLAAHPGIVTATCNMHSWSNDSGGLWSGCCYTSDHAKASCMWNKPAEIATGLGFARYPGAGYEIAFRGGGATPEQVLEAFKNSAPHNAVILNTGGWAFLDPYPAMGAAMRDGHAVVWFGDSVDPWR